MLVINLLHVKSMLYYDSNCTRKLHCNNKKDNVHKKTITNKTPFLQYPVFK